MPLEHHWVEAIMRGKLRHEAAWARDATSGTMAVAQGPSPEIRSERWCVHESSQIREFITHCSGHDRDFGSEDVIAKCDKGWCGAGQRENVS